MKYFLTSILFILLFIVFYFVFSIRTTGINYFEKNSSNEISNNNKKEPVNATTSKSINNDNNENYKNHVHTNNEIKKNDEFHKLPKNMNDVVFTDKLLKSFENLPPYSIDLFDYKLELYDRIQKCLESDLSSSGEIQLTLSFDIEVEAEVGISNKVELEGSFLNKEDTIKLYECTKISHIGHELNIQKFENGKTPFLNVNMTLNIPLKNDFVYKFIEYEGLPPGY